ncbi:CatB-related O-acetyltransferase [Aquincola sp. MAHUQ-54]|uniref:CatB-related O-acetyltransferase n=1 Tax=Aquincola agrisoli TaxID=3119538 RepID=A0AAW9QM49_9BURK
MGLLDKIIVKLARRNEMRSRYLRKYFQSKHRIVVGMYSYGCFDADRIGADTTIGRYCSIAPTVQVLRRNHSIHAISMHPFLFNSSVPFDVKREIPYFPCIIEDDVWIGHGAIILPAVNKVGRGAVVAAGAVVTKNVPPYSIVAGNPARVIRMRFGSETIEQIESTRWWMLDENELAAKLRELGEGAFCPERIGIP